MKGYRKATKIRTTRSAYSRVAVLDVLCTAVTVIKAIQSIPQQ